MRGSQGHWDLDQDIAVDNSSLLDTLGGELLLQREDFRGETVGLEAESAAGRRLSPPILLWLAGSPRESRETHVTRGNRG